MSDISMPPEEKKPQKKQLENTAVKSLFAFIGLAAPIPMLLTLINLWLKYIAPPGMNSNDPFTVFRQIIGQGGEAPIWLVPLALLPPFVLLMVLFRSGPGRFVAAMGLIVCASAETFYFSNMINP